MEKAAKSSEIESKHAIEFISHERIKQNHEKLYFLVY